MSLWGGVFSSDGPGLDPLFKRFNDSLPFDRALIEHDIRGSIAWAGALRGAGVLSGDECERLRSALSAVLEEVRARPALLAGATDEDVHSFVERLVTEKAGDVGRKLHTGRSRNDQVATDLRLYARAEAAHRVAEIRALQGALLDLAEREADIAFPGYTHLQRAQPILFAHWCLAYVEMLERDAGRLEAGAARAGECPLGAAALAGTAYDIDRVALARDLGFDCPCVNSLDAVASRDFVIETVSALAQCAITLSRMAEDLVIYASQEFALVRMSERVSTGSSIMPQKKNPDAMELIRGKAGRVVGALMSLMTTVKGLPLAYNKDLQEDKEPLFDAMVTIAMCLRVAAVAVEGLEINRERALEAAQLGYANATDLADYLVERGVPFRKAHEIAGRVVRHAAGEGLPIESLPLEKLQTFAPEISEVVFDRISLGAVLGRRNVPGGTAPVRVRDALGQARARLQSQGGSVA